MVKNKYDTLETFTFQGHLSPLSDYNLKMDKKNQHGAGKQAGLRLNVSRTNILIIKHGVKSLQYQLSVLQKKNQKNQKHGQI